jgi:hypothetical protein
VRSDRSCTLYDPELLSIDQPRNLTPKSYKNYGKTHN